MRKTILLVMGAVCCVFFATAQSEARFTVSVSTDSILLGNYFQVTFSLENAQGDKFEPPVFEDFDVVSGPNTASSFSMVNGKVTQSLSYSYYLEPKDIGNYYILPAAIEVDGKVLETQPLEVMVVPNPDGIKQTPGATQSQGFLPEDFKLTPEKEKITEEEAQSVQAVILFKQIHLSLSIRRYLWVAVLLGYSATASAQSKPTFEAAADARQILLNSFVEVSFTLINAEGKNFQPPDFNDFTVVSGPNRSVSTSLINGQFSTSAGYTYTLKPRRLGKLTIDPAGIRVDNRTLYTQKLEIEVLDSRQASSTAGEPFYMQAEAKPTRAWIGQQVLLDYKLYAEDHVGSFNPIGESKYDGFYVEEIRRFDAPWQREIVNKRQYYTKVLKRMALYPQRSGALQVDPYEVQLNILGDDPGGLSLFMPRPVKRIPAATPPAVIQVQPLPQPAPASFSGAVGHYSAVFGASLNDLTTDDALSLTIAVNGDGDIKRLQAPPIDFPESFEVYPPKVLEDRTYEENGRIMGKKVFEYILVPREAGIFTITPAFVYFDIDSAKYATVSADPITLNVRQGQSNRSGVAPTEIQNADAEIMPLKALSTRGAYHFSLWGTHWLWIGLVLPLLAVCTAWLLKRRRQSVEGRNSLEYHSQRARKTAIARLSTAKAHLDAGQSRSFYDEIEKGLIAYLGYKFDIPPAAWSKTLARQRMEEAGVDAALVAAFSQVIQTCEMALFAAKDQATDMQANYSAAADIIEKLET